MGGVKMYDLRDLVTVGRNAKVVHVVRDSDTATKYSKGLEEFMSTPAIISLAIQVSANAIDEFLPDGYISIGRSIEFEHIASSKVGMHVTVEAVVTEVQPLYIVLDIKASDEAGEIGFGKHKRSIVIVDKLKERARNRMYSATNSRS